MLEGRIVLRKRFLGTTLSLKMFFEKVCRINLNV